MFSDKANKCKFCYLDFSSQQHLKEHLTRCRERTSNVPENGISKLEVPVVESESNHVDGTD